MLATVYSLLSADTGRVIFEVILAAFAVFGFYCAIRTVGEFFLPLRPLSGAVKLYEESQVRELDILLQSARGSFSARRRNRIVVLISAALMQGCMGYGEVLRPEIEALLRRYDADCFVVDLSRERET